MPYILKHEKFEGPLDLLLELVEREKLEISEISLAKITDEYIHYVRGLNGTSPDDMAEFLVVAAQLLLIKSRSLLPSLEMSAEEEGSIEELEKRLAEYKIIKELAADIKKMESRRNFIFTREAFIGMEAFFYPPPRLTIEKIEQSFASFLAALPKIETLAQEKIKKIVSLEEKIRHIRSFLQESIEKRFSDIVKGAGEKVEVIVSFLAILELAKQKFLDLEQDRLFEDIKIKKTGEKEQP